MKYTISWNGSGKSRITCNPPAFPWDNGARSSGPVQGMVQPGDRSHCFVAFIGDDVITPLVALEDQSRIGEFPDVEEKISAPEAGHLRDIGECPRLDHEGF